MRGGGYGVIIRPLVNFAVGMFIFLSGYLTKENENGVYRDIIYRRIKKNNCSLYNLVIYICDSES